MMGIWKKSDLIQPLADHFNLSQEEVNQEYQSGKGSIFIDRIAWALSYFALTDLLNRPKRGYYQINELGKKFVNKSDEEINKGA